MVVLGLRAQGQMNYFASEMRIRVQKETNKTWNKDVIQ